MEAFCHGTLQLCFSGVALSGAGWHRAIGLQWLGWAGLGVALSFLVIFFGKAFAVVFCLKVFEARRLEFVGGFLNVLASFSLM